MTEVILKNDVIKNLSLITVGLDGDVKYGMELAIKFIEEKFCPRMVLYKYCPECGEKLYHGDEVVLLGEKE